jgi:hypothetical protein
MNSKDKPDQHDAASEVDARLTELMKAHLDDVTGGLAARHNQWKQSV